MKASGQDFDEDVDEEMAEDDHGEDMEEAGNEDRGSWSEATSPVEPAPQQASGNVHKQSSLLVGVGTQRSRNGSSSSDSDLKDASAFKQFKGTWKHDEIYRI